jgi:hypothetical protein
VLIFDKLGYIVGDFFHKHIWSPCFYWTVASLTDRVAGWISSLLLFFPQKMTVIKVDSDETTIRVLSFASNLRQALERRKLKNDPVNQLLMNDIIFHILQNFSPLFPSLSSRFKQSRCKILFVIFAFRLFKKINNNLIDSHGERNSGHRLHQRNERSWVRNSS